MSNVVKIELVGEVAVITIDNPPVNVLGVDVRQGLADAVDAAEANVDAKVTVICGSGRMFIAGADIREFGKPPQPPALSDVCDRIEACGKPVVAAIHGAALGGGLEVALAAHYRIAAPGAKLGLPEVNLGILPGAGGTQRTTRLAGAKSALDLMLSGRHIGPEDAQSIGLIDKIAENSDAQAAGVAMAREIIADNLPPRPTSEFSAGLDDDVANRAALKEARAALESKARGLFSPFRIVDAVEAAIDLPFNEGRARERELFLECMESPQRQGLIHAFFAEREVTKAPETKSAEPREIASVGVIGGGTMGGGITVALLNAGLPVTMVERDDESLARGRSNVEKVFGRQVAKGRMTNDAMAGVMGRYRGTTDYSAVAGADLIIEAAFEDMTVKKAIFAELDKCAKSGAVLATNTSYLNIDEIAAVTSRPVDVIGFHFFSPANIMKLLEIVVAGKTAPDVVATGFALAKRMGKTPVRAGVCDGFIGNRILEFYLTAAHRMMEDGASPYEIDGAVREFGYPIGPFQMTDLAGGDIGWANRKRKAATRDPNERYVHIADRLCERGWFGQKTARGYYRYEDGARVGKPDPEVEAIIAEEREKAGVTPRAFGAEEIIRRYLAAMINEGANVVADGIALRPLDVDVTLLYGYAFPRWRGGPMKYADMAGLAKVLEDIRKFSEEDPLFWQPSRLLVDLVENGKTFDSLNGLD